LTQIRNQLKSQDLSTLSASSIETVGGRVFPDNAAVPDLRALVEVLDAYRAVHVPTYGQPIPKTGDAATTTASALNTWDDVIAPANDEVHMLQFAGLYNSDASTPAQVDVAITDADGTAYVAASLDVPPQTFVNAFDLGNAPLFLDSNVSLQFRVKTGPFASVSIRTYSILVVK